MTLKTINSSSPLHEIRTNTEWAVLEWRSGAVPNCLVLDIRAQNLH